MRFRIPAPIRLILIAVVAMPLLPGPLAVQAQTSGSSVFDTGAAPVGGGPAPGGRPSIGINPTPPSRGGPGGPPGGDQNACMAEFLPIRQEAERRAELINAAGKRKAPPDEACKLIRSFAQQEAKMVSFVKAKSASCGVPPEVGKQMATAHSRTIAMQNRVCNIAANGPPQAAAAAAPSLSEAIGAARVPELNEARKGPSTFDTLTGNALAR